MNCCIETGEFCLECGFAGLQVGNLRFFGSETGGVCFEVICEIVDCFGKSEEMT